MCNESKQCSFVISYLCWLTSNLLHVNDIHCQFMLIQLELVVSYADDKCNADDKSYADDK